MSEDRNLLCPYCVQKYKDIIHMELQIVLWDEMQMITLL